MTLPPKCTIDIEENDSIRDNVKRAREWCSSIVGSMVWLSSIIPDATYVFRGHADVAWNLESSLKRSTGAATLKRLEREEGSLLRQVSRDFWFRREFEFISAKSPKSDNYERTVAVLQHHGIPTRLLDVTADPLVGLYFAVVGKNEADDMDGTNGAVVFIRNVTEDDELSIHVIPAPQISQRVPAQRARFIAPNGGGVSPAASSRTVSFDFAHVNVANESLTDFDNLVGNYLVGDFSGRPPAKAPNLLMFIVPGDMKPACRDVLRSLGVSAGTLFPGSEGFRRQLSGF